MDALDICCKTDSKVNHIMTPTTLLFLIIRYIPAAGKRRGCSEFQMSFRHREDCPNFVTNSIPHPSPSGQSLQLGRGYVLQRQTEENQRGDLRSMHRHR